MKKSLGSLVLALLVFSCQAQPRTFVGSTPAHAVVREFLGLPLTDSIDFIRWKLDVEGGVFTLHCRYGLAQPGTPGFSNEQKVAFEGRLTGENNHYLLQYQGKQVSLLEVNANVLHFLDENNGMLSGNGGYSYVLNNISPVVTAAINVNTYSTVAQGPLVFEGRTPCNALPGLLGIAKSEACNKMKWYFVFYTDTLTGNPSYFLMGGIGHREETMEKGRWQSRTDAKGRTVYQLQSDKWMHPLNLLKGDDNVLFFIDASGQPLVGNEDFSYTLNRRKEAYPRRE